MFRSVTKTMVSKSIKRLKTTFDHSDRISSRQSAWKFGCIHQYIIKTFAKYTDINACAKQGLPDRQEGMKKQIRRALIVLNAYFQKKSCHSLR
jgi:hypothetical protein